MPLLIPRGWQQHPQTGHKQIRCWSVNGVAMVSPIHITYIDVYSTPPLQPVSSRAFWPSCGAVQLHSGCWVQNQRCRGPNCPMPFGTVQQVPCSLNTQSAVAAGYIAITCNSMLLAATIQRNPRQVCRNAGLYRSAPFPPELPAAAGEAGGEAAGPQSVLLVTQLERFGARHMFPAFDHPSLKVRWAGGLCRKLLKALPLVRLEQRPSGPC